VLAARYRQGRQVGGLFNSSNSCPAYLTTSLGIGYPTARQGLIGVTGKVGNRGCADFPARFRTIVDCMRTMGLYPPDWLSCRDIIDDAGL